uniref:Uncharacterized protein n=1 Tax=Arundo donax TaxID=35708 RepID=A0A0A9CFP5_ARUDO
MTRHKEVLADCITKTGEAGALNELKSFKGKLTCSDSQ